MNYWMVQHHWVLLQLIQIMVNNQVLAQLELWGAPAGKYEKQVYTLPKHLDEKVAALHLAKVGAKLTRLTSAQAEYIGMPVSGPFKCASRHIMPTRRWIITSIAAPLRRLQRGLSARCLHSID